jgi:asparagine synthetase B (glutamine-hydrolysing)
LTDHEDLFIFNGELFDAPYLHHHHHHSSPAINTNTTPVELQNDSRWLFNALKNVATPAMGLSNGPIIETTMSEDEMVAQGILPILNTEVEGPFAFCWWRSPIGQQGASPKLWFGRDPIGRRSLLVGRASIQITSNAEEEGASMPTPTHITHINTLVICSTCLPTLKVPLDGGDSGGGATRFAQVKFDWTEFDPHQGIACLDPMTLDTKYFPWISDPMPKYSQRPPRLSDVAELGLFAAPPPPLHSDEVADALMAELHARLLDSVRKRITLGVPHHPPSSESTPLPVSNASIGVLFSGGLDSTVLAALVDEVLPPSAAIDLINVAFGPDARTCDLAPDRVSGRASLLDLQAHSPNRQWNFVVVNVTSSELAEKTPHVAHLMHPLDTVMDVSIAAPLWFAARGKGYVEYATTNATSSAGTTSMERREYQSTARILLVGAGADEQFGGYSRYRVAYQKRRGEGGGEEEGDQAVDEELQMDVERLWRRNLGRDDRVVSDHGKEARFPFLDRGLVSWLQSLPLRSFCNFDQELGQGDKMLLRRVASSLGLHVASALAKRAIQFGSRIAKQMPKAKGTDTFTI